MVDLIFLLEIALVNGITELKLCVSLINLICLLCRVYVLYNGMNPN